MRVVLASDHAGVTLRRRLVEELETRGHAVTDLGPDGDDSVDYPDYAARVARSVASGEAERGVLVCGTGIGMQIAANKVSGVRAVAPFDETTARMSRSHNDTNVVCFGERVQDPETVVELLGIWLDTEFDGGRHARRVDKITDLESCG